MSQHYKDNNDHASPYRVDSVTPQEWEATLEEDIEHIGNLERGEGSLSPCPSPRRGPWLRTRKREHNFNRTAITKILATNKFITIKSEKKVVKRGLFDLMKIYN